MLASQTPWECHGTTLWCADARFSTALAFFTSLSCELLFLVKKKLYCRPPPVFIILPFIAIIAAYLVYLSAAASGLGLTANVDQASTDMKEPA